MLIDIALGVEAPRFKGEKTDRKTFVCTANSQLPPPLQFLRFLDISYSANLFSSWSTSKLCPYLEFWKLLTWF